MSDRPRVLADRYELGDRLGGGGMATVFRGTDRVLGRHVAVKVLSSPFAADAGAVERFRREARAAAALSHPNVVSVYDSGFHDGVHFIVMELVEGSTLAEVIHSQGPLPPERAAAVAEAVCRALAPAHDRALVHRDLKPGNIMITPSGEVKVMDFGIARVAQEEPITTTGAVMGTASYLSPEQARGEAVDARSDLYSLGCVVYEMLTGRPPFTGESPVAVAHRHVEEAPVPPSAVNRQVPQELDAVVIRALAKNPAARFPTADVMAEALAAAGRPTVPLPAAPLPAAGEPTTPLRPAEAPTTPLRAADPSTAHLPSDREPPAAARNRRPEERERLWPFALAGAAVTALVLFLALDQSGERAAAPTSPSPTATPPPAVEQPVQQAGRLLAEAVDRAFAAGGLTAKARQDVLKRLEDALKEYAEGDGEAALEKAADVGSELRELAAEGEIAAGPAPSLVEAADLLTATIEANPPPAEERSGPGNGKGRGKKDDDD